MKIDRWVGMLVLFLCSCSTDFDIYTDYKDIPVVYGLINAHADTNFIKITKAFCNDNDQSINPFEAAQVYDSSNYPGKLDVFIEELKSVYGQAFQSTGRSFYLDTLTIHNKQEGLFYSPHQKVYFTTERFNTKNAHEKYRYKLYVVKPDGDMVTAETSVVDGDISLGNPKMIFQSEPSNKTASLLFTSTDEAILYEIGMQFNYREMHEGQPMVHKNVTWSYGLKPLGTYEKVVGSCYKHHFSVNALFEVMEHAIGNDTVWDENHPNVTRYMDDFYIFITAAGEDYYNYYQFMQAMQSGLSLSNEYTNVEGGCGLFSSYIQLRQQAQLSSQTKHDLFCKPWGFREQ